MAPGEAFPPCSAQPGAEGENQAGSLVLKAPLQKQATGHPRDVVPGLAELHTRTETHLDLSANPIVPRAAPGWKRPDGARLLWPNSPPPRRHIREQGHRQIHN